MLAEARVCPPFRKKRVDVAISSSSSQTIGREHLMFCRQGAVGQKKWMMISYPREE